MTAPFGPRSPGPAPEPGPRETGARARASSVNEVLAPLAFLAAHITPTYQRPPERPCDGVDMAPSSTPLLPMHGAVWEDEDSTAGALQAAVIGQHQRYAVAMPVVIVGATGVTLTDTASGVVMTQAVTTSIAATGEPDGPLRPVELAQYYPEVGACCWSSRDLGQEWIAVAQPSVSVIDPYYTTLGGIDIEVTDTATIMHIPWATRQGVSTTAASATGELDFDEWPVGSPITVPFGSPGSPRSVLRVPGALRDLAALDRSVYARQGAVLAAMTPQRGYTTQGSDIWTMLVRGLFHTLPTDRLPGSANVTTASSGSTTATRGCIVCKAHITDLEIAVGIRKVVPAGDYGESSTLGAWAWTHETGPSSTPTVVTVEALLPTGIAPGDMYEVAVGIRSSVDTDVCYGWVLYEPALSTL